MLTKLALPWASFADVAFGPVIRPARLQFTTNPTVRICAGMQVHIMQARQPR